jgi:hypothetical protein
VSGFVRFSELGRGLGKRSGCVGALSGTGAMAIGCRAPRGADLAPALPMGLRGLDSPLVAAVPTWRPGSRIFFLGIYIYIYIARDLGLYFALSLVAVAHCRLLGVSCLFRLAAAVAKISFFKFRASFLQCSEW